MAHPETPYISVSEHITLAFIRACFSSEYMLRCVQLVRHRTAVSQDEKAMGLAVVLSPLSGFIAVA